MANEFKIIKMTEAEKNKYIGHLVDELPVLRTKLGISQDEMASLLGISRQTYSTIETKRRKMSWTLFLSLILIFDNNKYTHAYIRKIGIFPQKIFNRQDSTGEGQQLSLFVQMDKDDIKNHLDEQAIHAIETVIIMEYARCNNLPGDVVIKAFDGKRLSQISEDDIKAATALNNLKRSGKK